MARKLVVIILAILVVPTQMGVGVWSVSTPVENQDLSRSAGFDANGGSPNQGLPFTGSLLNGMNETDVV